MKTSKKKNESSKKTDPFQIKKIYNEFINKIQKISNESLQKFFLHHYPPQILIVLVNEPCIILAAHQDDWGLKSWSFSFNINDTLLLKVNISLYFTWGQNFLICWYHIVLKQMKRKIGKLLRSRVFQNHLQFSRDCARPISKHMRTTSERP